MQLRGDMAKAALPFLHQKLTTIAIDDLGGPEAILDLSRLTNEELNRLEQILAKTK